MDSWNVQGTCGFLNPLALSKREPASRLGRRRALVTQRGCGCMLCRCFRRRPSEAPSPSPAPRAERNPAAAPAARARAAPHSRRAPAAAARGGAGASAADFEDLGDAGRRAPTAAQLQASDAATAIALHELLAQAAASSTAGRPPGATLPAAPPRTRSTSGRAAARGSRRATRPARACTASRASTSSRRRC